MSVLVLFGFVIVCIGSIHIALQLVFRSPMIHGYAHACATICLGFGVMAGSWLLGDDQFLKLGTILAWIALCFMIIVGYDSDKSAKKRARRFQKKKVDRHAKRQLRTYRTM